MRLTTKILAAFALSLGLLASTSSADLVLVVEDLGDASSKVIVLDDNPGGGVSDSGLISNKADASGVVGIVQYSGTVGGFFFTLNAGFSKPNIGGNGLARLDLLSGTVGGGAGSTLRVKLTDTGFGSPYHGFSIGDGGGTDGTVNATVTYDTDNLEFGTGVDINTGDLTGDFVFVGNAWVPADPSFSLSILVDISHDGDNDFTSFDLDVQVPEPASLSLLGLGAIALVRRRRRK